MNDDPYSLDRLNDIVQPDPVGWWPPSAFVGCLLILAGIWVAYGMIRLGYRWRSNAYRRAAMEELGRLQSVSIDQRLSGLSELLKRVALVAYPREEVASLTGQDWLAFLNRTSDRADFLQGPAARLGDASYSTENPIAESDWKVIVETARTWIAGHRVEIPT